VLVELGSSEYLKRYKTYVVHVREWRQQFQKLESVNLRYDNQVIVNPDMEGRSKQPALAASAAKAAAAAGVKPAALITRMNSASVRSAGIHSSNVHSASVSPVMVPHDRTLPKPAFELTEKKLDPKAAAAKKPAAKPKARRTTTKAKSPAAKKVVAKTAAPSKLQKTEMKKPAPPAPVHPAIPKPSAAIAKQPTNTSSN